MISVKNDNYKAVECASKKVITTDYESLKKYTEKQKGFP